MKTKFETTLSPFERRESEAIGIGAGQRTSEAASVDDTQICLPTQQGSAAAEQRG